MTYILCYRALEITAWSVCSQPMLFKMQDDFYNIFEKGTWVETGTAFSSNVRSISMTEQGQRLSIYGWKCIIAWKIDGWVLISASQLPCKWWLHCECNSLELLGTASSSFRGIRFLQNSPILKTGFSLVLKTGFILLTVFTFIYLGFHYKLTSGLSNIQ